MADDEDHCGPISSKSAVAGTPWKHQQSFHRWCLTNDSARGHGARLGGNEVGQKAAGHVDIKSIQRYRSADGEDESGLELCLGLSLGGSVCKAKSKNGQQELSGSFQAGGEKVMEEDTSTRWVSKYREGLISRVSQGGTSHTQAFWQELLFSREGLKEEMVSPVDVDDVVRERHAQIHSGSSTRGDLFRHAEWPEIWSSIENLSEGSKADVAHQYRKPVQENASLADKTVVNDEMGFLKDLLRAPTKAGPASCWGLVGQGGGAMQILDRVKDNRERDPRSIISSGGQKSSSATYSVQANRSFNSLLSRENLTNEDQLSADGGRGSLDKSRSMGKGVFSCEDENCKSAAGQQLRQLQDAAEQQKKHKRQEARKKRKAFLEEQKLQKKSKKDDECSVGSGQPAKPMNQAARPGNPASGSKVSSTGPLPATSREISIGTLEVSSPPESQDGENTNFGGTGGVMWDRGGVGEGPATSAPGIPPDNADIFIENDDGKQLLEIRRALQRERDRAAKDKGREFRKEKQTESIPRDCERKNPGDAAYPQPYTGEDPTRLHPGGDLAIHDPNTAVSASNVNPMEVKAVQSDPASLQRKAEMQSNKQVAYVMAAEQAANKEMWSRKVPDLGRIQSRGDLHGMQRRPNLGEIQCRAPPPGFVSVDSKRVEAFGQGVKSNVNLTNRTASSSMNALSTYSGQPLQQVLSRGSVCVPGGGFSILQSIPSQQAISQIGPVLTRSNSGRIFQLKVGNGNSSSCFSTLLAAVESSQVRAVAVASTLDGGDQCPSVVALSSYVQEDIHEEMNEFTTSSKVDQQGGPYCTDSFCRVFNSNEQRGKSFQANRFQQGTTQTIPTSESLEIHLGQEVSSLKRGIAAGQTFGGSGSSPDLPWVRVTGVGSKAKNICGVLYRYKKGQVKIVCACHGCHMSPREFVEHAGNVDLAYSDEKIRFWFL